VHLKFSPEYIIIYNCGKLEELPLILSKVVLHPQIKTKENLWNG